MNRKAIVIAIIVIGYMLMAWASFIFLVYLDRREMTNPDCIHEHVDEYIHDYSGLAFWWFISIPLYLLILLFEKCIPLGIVISNMVEKIKLFTIKIVETMVARKNTNVIHSKEKEDRGRVKRFDVEVKPDQTLKQAMLDELSKESAQVLEVAYIYAKNYVLYGIDVTKAWNTATEQSDILARVKMDSFYEGYRKGQVPKWNPVKTRPLTNAEELDMLENSDYYTTFAYACQIPEDEEEVLITTRGGDVVTTTFFNEGLDGCWFECYEDDGDVVAWMSKPTPYVAEEEDNNENQ